MIQPTYGEIKNTKTIKTENRVKAEVNFALTEDIKKSVSVNAKAFLISSKCENGKTEVKSKVVFTLVYLSEDGYKKIETDTDVSTSFPFENCMVSISVSDAKLLSGGSCAAVNVIFSAENKIFEEKTYLTGGEGVILKENTEEVDVRYLSKDNRHIVSDEFDLDYSIKEVLTHNSIVVLNEVGAGLGRIIFEGEIILTLKALPFSENNDILKERKIIPFRYELDYADCSPEMLVFGNAEIVSSNLKVFSDEEKNTSRVSVDVGVFISGEAVGKERVSFIEDAYSKEFNCGLTVNNLKLNRFIGRKVITERISGTVGESLDGGRIVTAMGESLLVYGTTYGNETLNIDGAVRCDVVIRNSDNGISTKVAEIPYSVEVSEKLSVENVKISLLDLSAKLRNGEIEIDASLLISYNAFEEKIVACVEDITEGERRNLSQSAISVFIPTKGDGIWEIAKQFGSDEDEIKRLNPNLEFPLSGDERIIIYRQKI